MAPRPNSAAAPSSRSSSKPAKASLKTSSRPKKPVLEFEFLTLFPELFPPILGASLLGRAAEQGLVKYRTHAYREFATDRYRTVDDSPYGGGAGMLLKAEILYAAWKQAVPRKSKTTRTILMSPQGPRLTQKRAHELLRDYRKIVLVCGHYEGLDERFIDACVDEEISIGDYVLTGGELPAMVVADVLTRLVPGVVGNPASLTDESLENGLLKSPQYTRPRVWQGREVPEVLLGGNHKAISAWRQAESERRTKAKRPDLWERLLAKLLGECDGRGD